jgi:Ca-activated chloride channel family protein
MRNATTLVAVLSLVVLVAVPPMIAQTRARRVDQNPSNPPTSQSTDAAKAAERAEGVDVIRTTTTLVTVPVSVLDRDGKYIPDLQKEDFQVYEEGIEQQLAYFATVEKAVTVVLMLDTSSSIWSKLDQIRNAAKAFVEELGENDRVMVVSFASGLTVECEPTADREKIRKAINGTGKGLSTHLYDAMNKLMQKHLNRIEGRKALVLFTDGVDATSSKATYESTVHTAEELDATIYTIRYDTYDRAADTGGSSAPQSGGVFASILRKLPLPITIGSGNSSGAGSSRADYDRGESYLRELAESTGGRAYEAGRDLNSLRDAFSRIAHELGRQYTLGYYPTKREGLSGRRVIKVRVNKRDVVVRARASYIYRDSRDNTKPNH